MIKPGRVHAQFEDEFTVKLVVTYNVYIDGRMHVVEIHKVVPISIFEILSTPDVREMICKNER